MIKNGIITLLIMVILNMMEGDWSVVGVEKIIGEVVLAIVIFLLWTELDRVVEDIKNDCK